MPTSGQAPRAPVIAVNDQWAGALDGRAGTSPALTGCAASALGNGSATLSSIARRGLDRGLEIGPRLLLAAVRAGVDDRGCGLGREQHEYLLILVGERRSALLLGKE